MNYELIEALRNLEFNNRQILLADRRLAEIFHLRGNFNLKRYTSLSEWEKRKAELKTQILVSAGLWPLPPRCDLRARVFDKQTCDGFTIEKVVFESYPGYYVTGNLYRPLEKAGLLPAIVNAHGHWEHGRMESTDICNIPLRCANLAKMGFIAFVYDMVGYQDSKQLQNRRCFLHWPCEPNETDCDDAHGDFPEKLWGINLFGLQLWNSMRSIDFVQSLPEVDTEQIGFTGASGGATQTLFVAATDERVKVSIPVNIISAVAFQWGCVCENAPNLWIGTNSVEIASLMAPRPQLVVSCTGDSPAFESVEYPAIRSIYNLYGATDDVECFVDDAVHNYNKNTREAAYRWFRKYFLDQDAPWAEQELSLGDVSRFNISLGDVAPAGIQEETELIELLTHGKQETLQDLYDDASEKGKATLRTALQSAIGIPESSNDISVMEEQKICSGDVSITQTFIGTQSNEERISVAIVYNEQTASSKKAALVVHPNGRNRLFTDAVWGPMLTDLLEQGVSVVAPDVFRTSEVFDYARLGKCDSSAVTYFSAYNRTDTAWRIQDIVTVYRYLRSAGYQEIQLIGLEEAGAWCLAALPFLPDIKCAVIDLAGMEPDNDDWYMKKFFVPCFRAAGGFKTALCLSSLDMLVLCNAAGNPYAEQVKQMYKQAGMEAKVIFYEHKPPKLNFTHCAMQE